MANPTQDDVDRAVAVARTLEQQGYFRRVKTGDERAASYFARMVASKVNPDGNVNEWGWLKKTAGGFNVEGYADGAIVFGNNPADLANVLKIVTQVGSTNPNDIQIGRSVQPRRQSDIWDAPSVFTEAMRSYLLSGGQPGPIPPPAPTVPSYEAMGGDEGGKRVTRLMEADYKNAGKPGLDGDSGAWQWRTAYDFLVGTFKTVEASIAAHQPEWRASLNQERISQGKPPIAW